MASLFHCRGFKICRVCFRWGRITFLLVILAAVIACVYVDRYGPPEFVKADLARTLAKQGIGVDFGRLRWRWYHGCVAEGLICAKTNGGSVWRFTAREAALDLKLGDLMARRVRLNSILLDHATLSWQSRTNSSRLVLRQISSDIQLASGDRVVLDDFRAVFGGVKIHLGGALTNAAALADLFSRPNRPKRDPETILQETVAWMDRIQVPQTASFDLLLAGDAREPSELKGALKCLVPEVRTPWGAFRNTAASLDLNRRGATTGSNPGTVRLELGEALTVWGAATNLLLTARFTPASPDLLLMEGLVKLRLGAASGFGVQGEDLVMNLSVVQALTNNLPDSLRGKISGRRLVTRWGGAESLDASLNVKRRGAPPPGPGGGWAPIARLAPWSVQLDAAVTKVVSPKIEIDSARVELEWAAPALAIKRFDGKLYGGRVALTSSLNVDSRETAAEGSFDFNVKPVIPLLPPTAQKWLSQFDWEKPPAVEGRILLTLPPWGQEHPAWKRDVMPTLKLAGTAVGGAGKFRGVPATGVKAAFAFTNDTWTLPAVHATRAEGGVDFTYQGSVLTHDFLFEGSGEIDPFAVRPLTPPKFHRFFEWFSFKSPPHISGVITGNWRNHQQAALDAMVSATNFTFKGVGVDSYESSVQASNLWLRLTRAAALRQGAKVTADEAAFDFKSHFVAITNLHSNLDPALAVGMLSPVLATNLQPFEFTAPPEVTIDGGVSTRDFSEHDLTLDIKGAGVGWGKIQIGPFIGGVHWKNREVFLTNFVVHPPRGPGAVSGWSTLRYTPGAGAAFSLNSTFADLDIRSVASHFVAHTNRLEGVLGGNLVITSGRTDSLEDWQGHGHLTLRDGFVWEFPIFGVFSPILDAITPGLGESTATEASAAFVITNGVVRTDNLEIHSPVLRMDYNGTVDSKGNVKAVVEARVPRNSWLLGPVLNVLFEPLTKLFACKVGGTLASPKMEPMFLPKFVMMALHPFRTLRELGAGPPKKDAKDQKNAGAPH